MREGGLDPPSLKTSGKFAQSFFREALDNEILGGRKVRMIWSHTGSELRNHFGHLLRQLGCKYTLQ